MNWFLVASVLLYIGGAVYEGLRGSVWVAALLMTYAASNFCLLWVGK